MARQTNKQTNDTCEKNNKMTHAKNQNNRKREAKITNESEATIKKKNAMRQIKFIET